MNTESATRLRVALDAPDSSARLQAAMTAGTHPHDEQVAVLIDQCAVEPDFSVREMLTWALMRHPVAETMPLLLAAVRGGGTQARSQALHTLSKIGDARGWEAITPQVLADSDPMTARTAWRAAAILAPDDAKPALATLLIEQLGRGDSQMQNSLSRSLVALGDAADAALGLAAQSGDPAVRRHAVATLRLAADPDESFETAMFEAGRGAGPAPSEDRPVEP